VSTQRDALDSTCSPISLQENMNSFSDVSSSKSSRASWTALARCFRDVWEIIQGIEWIDSVF